MALKTHWRCCALLTTLLVACTTEARLRAGGNTPYVRCLAGPEPSDRTVTIGKAKLTIHGRRLEVTGLPEHPAIAAFSGPGFGDPAQPAAVAGLGQAGADLAFMIGGLGETEASAAATVAAFAGLDRPVLFVAGGRDQWSAMRPALDGQPSGKERIIDVTGMREVRIGKHTFVPVAGAENGRYAAGEGACGFAASDLAELQRSLGAGNAASAPRWLVSWHAPAAAAGQIGVTRTESGLDTGSWTLSRFAAQAHVNGTLSAWPVTQAGRSSALGDGTRQTLVPRLWGPREERDDGSLAPIGFALFRLGERTLDPAR